MRLVYTVGLTAYQTDQVGGLISHLVAKPVFSLKLLLLYLNGLRWDH